MNLLESTLALEKVMADIKPFVRDNIVVQADGDSGDSAQRTATLYAMAGIIGKPLAYRRLKDAGLSYEQSIQQHEVSPGIYRRSNDAGHWGSNPNNFSRDQWSIMQLAFATNGDTKRLKESMWQLLKRGLVHQNVHPGTDAPADYRKFPDVAHPSHFSVFIRGMGLWPLYPVLVLIDLLLLADVSLRMVHDPANDIDNMLSQHILYAQKYTTPASYVAMQVYKRSSWKQKLRAYHGPARNGIPPLADLIVLAYDIRGR